MGSATSSLISFQAGQPVADDNVPEQHETVCALAQNELDGLVLWHGMVNGPVHIPRRRSEAFVVGKIGINHATDDRTFYSGL
jgi:hypothetical protein